MKITVFGYYGKNNTGDESYKLAFTQLLSHHQLTFTDSLIKPDDTIILGGGDILNPSFLNQLHKHPKTTKYAFSVNVTENSDLSLFKKVISRNKSQVTTLPDFTFILKANHINGINLIQDLFKRHQVDTYNKIVIIVLNCYLICKHGTLARDYVNFEKVCFDLANLMDSTPANFILLPFGNGFPVNDRIANSNLYSKCKFWKKNLIVYEKLSVDDTLDICSAADAVISTRLHSSIFACIGGTPFIDLTHHNKTKLFLEYINHPEWSVNYWKLDYVKLKHLLDNILVDKSIRGDLTNLAAEYRQTLLNADLFG